MSFNTELLKKLRKENKLTYEALALECDISTTYLWKLEHKDIRSPSAEAVYRVAKYFNLSIEDFLIKEKK